MIRYYVRCGLVYRPSQLPMHNQHFHYISKLGISYTLLMRFYCICLNFGHTDPFMTQVENQFQTVLAMGDENLKEIASK